MSPLARIVRTVTHETVTARSWAWRPPTALARPSPTLAFDTPSRPDHDPPAVLISVRPTPRKSARLPTADPTMRNRARWTRWLPNTEQAVRHQELITKVSTSA